MQRPARVIQRCSATIMLAALVALAGCQTAPPRSTLPIASPPISAAPVPGTSGSGTASLADALRDAVSTDAILSDLGRLNDIADANGGNRAAGSTGHEGSVQLVAEGLRAVGYEVSLEPVAMTAFRQDAPSVVEILAPGAPALEDVRDLKTMLLSPSGDVTASLYPVGFDPAAKPGDRNGRGCDPSDWASVPAGVIALVQPGNCRRRDAILNAQAAGVVGIITSYADWAPDHLLRPTLIQPDGLTIPAVGVTGAAGLALLGAAQAGSKVHLAVHTTVSRVESQNVLAETPGGDPAHVVMVGGHLDSVVDGPGINDDGSGTMTNLEIARELARLRPQGAPWKVRFAFWTGEEVGLLGSSAYVNGLSVDDVAGIAAYVNFDMLASPNGVREIYDAAGTQRPAAGRVLQDLFAAALDAEGVSSKVISLGGQSDHFPFDQRGLPVGGLFSGANEIKTEPEAGSFGGRAGAAEDACYHLACDTKANLDRQLLDQLAKAAAWTIGRLASGEVAVPEG
jgi:Zn-dependent M28 family amino/carboxypeptidase